MSEPNHISHDNKNKEEVFEEEEAEEIRDEDENENENEEEQEEEEKPGKETPNVTFQGGDSVTSAEASRERIVQSLYDHFMTSICIDVACNMHELIKTGEYSLAELMEPFSRQEIYPELYPTTNPPLDENDERTMGQSATMTPTTHHNPSSSSSLLSSSPSSSIQDVLEYYAVEVPQLPTRRRKRPLRSFRQGVDGSNDATEQSLEDDPTNDPPEALPTPTMQTRHTINHSDIWGRLPPKEPKQTCRCQICGRHVSTLRFAPHLDKCMGLSTRPSQGGGSSS